MNSRDKHLRDRIIRDSVGSSIVPVSWILAGFYALLAIVHPIFLSAPRGWVMSMLAGMSALSFLTIALRRPFDAEISNPHRLMGLMSSLVGINTCLHFLLFPEAPNTANFIVWILGNGFLVLSRRWFLTLTLSAIGFWVVMVLATPITPLYNWGWFYLFALCVTLLVHAQRQYAMRGIAWREAMLTRRDSALQSLVSAPELFKEDVSKVFQQVCRIATEQLDINRAGIWLTSTDQQAFRRVMMWEQQPNPDEVLILRRDIPEFFERVVTSPSVSLENVGAEPKLNHALRNAGVDLDGRGLLISRVLVSGAVKGIFVGVDVKQRIWSIEDRAFGASLANIVAIAIQHDQSLHLEKRAQQAERLESLGILAGGVAHDFNNLLTVILGHAELLDLDTEASHPSKPGLQAILDAGARARDLSKQMLAYSGRAVFVTKTTNLTTFIRDMTGQLARELLGDTALIADIEESNPFVVDIDVTQIRQVLLNLLLNARHANAQHVNVSVGTTYLTETPQQCVIDLELYPLQYHWLEVADDGCGMDNHTLARIFDPFFSTRTDGSGLGLAAVLGILRAHKGTISVKSSKGNGTQIRVYFPASTEVVRDTVQALENGKDNRISKKNFLLVEDDPLVRDMTSTILTMEDNNVLSLSGLEAVNARLADAASTHSFDLAVIDLTLGQDSGIDVLRKLRSCHPQLPAVIMSGYDAMDALAGYSDENTVVFLQKPFNQQQLWNALRQAQGLAVNI